MFNSQKINSDPHPYKVYGGSMTRCDKPGFVGKYDPRPEYDNNPNPILVQFRETQKEKLPYSDTREWLYFLNKPLPDSWNYATKEHVVHARKVLERLVNVYGSH